MNQATFDPTDTEHIKAFVALTHFNKQHPTLRFKVEKPYIDVRAMMHGKVAEVFAKQHGVIDEVRELLQLN